MKRCFWNAAVRLAVLALVIASSSQPFTVRAQGSAFTYQGRLNDGGAPANGSYDLRFSLFDAGVAGNQQGPILTNTATAVSNGLFTVTLDFGNQFPGAARWLEIGVRTNSGTFATLNPRQALTPAPYAITAESLISGGLAAGAYGNAVTFNNAANQFAGAFSGNGANVTNVNAATLGGLTPTNFWQLGGNMVAAGQFLGSANNQPLDLWVNGARGWRLDPGPTDTSHSNAVNVVGGSLVNFVAAGVSGSTVSGGGALNYNGAPGTNSVVSDFGVVGGGLGNSIQSFANVSSIGGGFRNSIQSGANSSTIAGGAGNTIQSNAFDGFIGGGSGNTVGAYYSAIGGGNGNVATNTYSTVVGGQGNLASGSCAVVGGDHSTASGQDSMAFGHSLASAQYSTGLGFSIALGTGSTAIGLSDATGNYSTAMGYLSVASGYGSTAMGNSSASATNSSAFGNSSATNSYATAMGYQSIAGGVGATAMGEYSFAFGDCSTAMGKATASGTLSSALGAVNATGNFSTALGGSLYGGVTEARGESSFAAGAASFALHDFSFVWSDGSLPAFTSFTSTSGDQFLIHANGGVGIGTNAPSAALHVVSAAAPYSGAPQAQLTQLNSSDAARLRMNVNGYLGWEMDVSAGPTPQLQFWYVGAAGPRLTIDTSGNAYANSFNATSDRNAKENFRPVDACDVLNKVARLSITRWNFKTDTATVHVGPMAQDFYAAFDVGTDDKHIATVDEEGVALAAIQGLNQKVEAVNEKSENRIKQLEMENERLKQANESLESRLTTLEKAILSRNEAKLGN